MRLGLSTIYPNMYIVLVGPSGAARKGEPIEVIRDLAQDVETITTVGENNTREAIIRKMSRSTQNFEHEDEKQFHCSMSCFCEELSVFLGFQNTNYTARS
jgi:ribose 1,5-bisphosphokinase PhnN